MSRVHEVTEAYEAWDPAEESSEELAARLGISKARLYQILDKEGITPKARRPKDKSLAEMFASGEIAFAVSRPPENRDSEGDLLEALTERGIRSLIEELEKLRKEVIEYRRRFGPLD